MPKRKQPGTAERKQAAASAADTATGTTIDVKHILALKRSLAHQTKMNQNLLDELDEVRDQTVVLRAEVEDLEEDLQNAHARLEEAEDDRNKRDALRRRTLKLFRIAQTFKHQFTHRKVPEGAPSPAKRHRPSDDVRAAVLLYLSERRDHIDEHESDESDVLRDTDSDDSDSDWADGAGTANARLRLPIVGVRNGFFFVWVVASNTIAEVIELAKEKVYSIAARAVDATALYTHNTGLIPSSAPSLPMTMTVAQFLAGGGQALKVLPLSSSTSAAAAVATNAPTLT